MSQGEAERLGAVVNKRPPHGPDLGVFLRPQLKTMPAQWSNAEYCLRADQLKTWSEPWLSAAVSRAPVLMAALDALHTSIARLQFISNSVFKGPLPNDLVEVGTGADAKAKRVLVTAGDTVLALFAHLGRIDVMTELLERIRLEKDPHKPETQRAYEAEELQTKLRDEYCRHELLRIGAERGEVVSWDDKARLPAVKRLHEERERMLKASQSLDPVNKANDEGITPLEIAIANGHWALMKLLVQHDAIITPRAFSLIAAHKSPEPISFLEQQPGTPHDLAAPIACLDHEVTALHLACRDAPLQTFIDILNYAMERARTKDLAPLFTVVDDAGETPWDYAASAGRLDLLRHMVEDRGISLKNTSHLFHYACRDAAALPHIKELLTFLYEQQVGVYTTDRAGKTALHYLAASDAHLPLLTWLFEMLCPPSVDIATQAGVTLLHTACTAGAHETALYLLQHGADAHCVSEIERLASIHYAARGGCVPIVTALVNDYDCNPLLAFPPHMRSPVHYAAEAAHVDVVSELFRLVTHQFADENEEAVLDTLRNDTSPPSTTPTYDSSVPYDAETDRMERLVNKKRLLERQIALHGGRRHYALLVGLHLACKPDGARPLHLAVRAAADRVVECLLELGAAAQGPLAKVLSRNTTPLLEACQLSPSKQGALRTAIVLLDHCGAGCVNEPMGPDRRTPLWLAASVGHAALVEELLVRRQAKPEQCDRGGKTPLMAAIFHAPRELVCDTVRTLLNHGASAVTPTKQPPLTPLAAAAKLAHPELVRLLLDHAAAHNLPDLLNTSCHRGCTPLHLAIFDPDEEMPRLERFRKPGFDEDALERDHRDRELCVRYLLEAGAEPNTVDDVHGGSALQLAMIHGGGSLVETFCRRAQGLTRTHVLHVLQRVEQLASRYDPLPSAQAQAIARAACDSRRRTCGACRLFDASNTMLLCANCDREKYCDQACQRADWKSHKPVCNKKKK